MMFIKSNLHWLHVQEKPFACQLRFLVVSHLVIYDYVTYDDLFIVLKHDAKGLLARCVLFFFLFIYNNLLKLHSLIIVITD